jgi:NAD(P)-dependent dehydrogenase (short-subunit alcohol dehydrogenase family)
VSAAAKGALVTGGSRGIGAACARALAAAGLRVAVHYAHGADAAERVRAALPGTGHCTLQADLAEGSIDAARALIEAATARLDGLAVLVNNAGVYDEHPPLTTTESGWRAAWQDTLALNLLAPAHLSYHAARTMAAAGGGRIVNVSSRGAFRGEPAAPAYGASKAGLNSLSQSLAQAFAPRGVLVYVVAPGFVGTDMAAALLAGPQGDAIRAQSPLGRVSTPEEVAACVRFCALEAPAAMTGAILDVNGASYLRS